MVEFAIVLPLLLLVIVGVLELGVILIQDNSLNKATREASRYLVSNWNIAGCYKNIAEDVIKINMTDMFASGYTDWNNSTDSVVSEQLCINETTGVIANSPSPETITANCSGTPNFCLTAAGTHLHVRTTVTYNHTMITNTLFGLNFAPTLRATSIMRVQQ